MKGMGIIKLLEAGLSPCGFLKVRKNPFNWVVMMN